MRFSSRQVVVGVLTLLIILSAVVFSIAPTPDTLLAANDLSSAYPEPTRQAEATRRAPFIGPHLILADVECEDEGVRVHFLLVGAPERVADFGEVTYSVNGERHQAEFIGRRFLTAH